MFELARQNKQVGWLFPFAKSIPKRLDWSNPLGVTRIQTS